MAYTCAVYPTEDATLEAGAVRPSSTWSPQARAASPACGCSTSAAAGAAWSCTPPSTTASRRWASRCPGSRPSGRRRPSSSAACPTWPRCGTPTTATCAEGGFDAVSSIGLTEHIGEANLPAYFQFLYGKLRPGGAVAQPLHHPAGQPPGSQGRRVHQPLRLPGRRARGPGTLMSMMTRHRLRGAARGEPARALRHDAARAGAPTSTSNWDAAVAEVGAGTARVWRLYMAALAGRLRTQPHPAAPDARRQARRRPLAHAAARRLGAAPVVRRFSPHALPTCVQVPHGKRMWLSGA